MKKRVPRLPRLPRPLHRCRTRRPLPRRTQLGEAQLVLLPSIAEVLPVCLMEAQASGLPVIATDVGAVREVVLDGLTGRVVPPGDASALAKESP